MSKHLPTDAKERKKIPLYTGLIKYFPDALVEVAKLSWVGNEQHNPGEPLHWAREKSNDQEDTLMRHLLESGTIDTDGVRHSVKVAWRALAAAQLEIEEDRKKSQVDKDPSTVYSVGTTTGYTAPTVVPTADWYDRWSSELVRDKVHGPFDGKWTAVPTDQADGCASDAPTRNEIAAHQYRLRFNGDGDRNG